MNGMIDPLKLSIDPDPASDGSKTLPKIVRHCLAAISVVAVVLCVQGYRSIVAKATTPYCAANLKNIGIACLMYADRHNGNFPDTLEETLRTTGLTVASLICPATNDDPAPGETAAEQIARLHEGHHLSYVYSGKGLTTSVPNPSTVILAYEPLSNHKGDGANFLFADGHVQWMEAREAKALIAAIPATQPTTAP